MREIVMKSMLLFRIRKRVLFCIMLVVMVGIVLVILGEVNWLVKVNR